MGIKDYIKRLTAARRRREPKRDTVSYARLMNIGGTGLSNQRTLAKPLAPNLRYFSRTPYARAAIRRIRDPLITLKWVIAPAEGVKTNRVLEEQIAVATTCFKHPNRDNNWADFLGLVVEDWLCFGAAVFEQQLGNDPARPLWLWPVDAQSIQIYAGWSGDTNEARYVQTVGLTNVGFLEGQQLRNDELVYIRANSSNETPYGYGALEIAFNTINRQLGVAEYAGNLASNAQPQFLLWFEKAGSDELRAYRTYWRNEVEGQGVTPMYGGPNEPKAIQLHPGGDEALYLKYQDFVIREIATAFGLSPMNLGIEGDVNRSTAEVGEDRDWDNTIIPTAELISDYITREVLHQKLGFYHLEFRFEGLYREDEENIANIYQTEYINNAITPNEYREARGKPKLDSQWADLTSADVQIALAAARGTKQMDDEDLPQNPSAPPTTKSKKKTNSENQNKSSFDND